MTYLVKKYIILISTGGGRRHSKVKAQIYVAAICVGVWQLS
jgi:hypothetical protein